MNELKTDFKQGDALNAVDVNRINKDMEEKKTFLEKLKENSPYQVMLRRIKEMKEKNNSDKGK